VQTASETIALKGLGYGLEALRADGNDVFAVHEIVRYAAEKARRGDGATFIELLTYRVSAHTSSDDPSRYRDESVTQAWRHQKDPVRRLELYLVQRGWLAEGERATITEQLEAEVRDVIARQEAIPPPPLSSIVDDVYEAPTWNLREQLGELEAAPRAKVPHHH
jgi:TPP-dependent pyruvate/acetoin dehydrogenase alpha subunit